MNPIKFNLKNPKAKEPTLIFLIYRLEHDLLKISTGLKIHPSYWKFDQQKVKKSCQDSKLFNDVLNTYRIKLKKLVMESIVIGKKMSQHELKCKLLDKPYEQMHSSSFLQYMDEYIAIKKHTWSKSTYLNYLNTLKVLKQFYTEFGVEDHFDVIDLEFYNKYLSFLYGEPRSYSINNVGKHIQNVKAVLNASVSKGVNTNLKFKHQQFKKPVQKTVQIYLTMDELEQIKNTSISNVQMDQARDILIVLSFTGLRYSDVFKVGWNAIRTLSSEGEIVKVIEVLVMKTGKVVSIPLHPYVKDIIDKYDGELPHYSNPMLNKLIKEVARIAGIDSIVRITSSRAGKPIEIVKPKHELICTHIGRRSMITNMYLADINSQSIRMISGHSTEKEFQKYIRISLQQNSINLSRHTFFQKSKKTN